LSIAAARPGGIRSSASATSSSNRSESIQVLIASTPEGLCTGFGKGVAEAGCAQVGAAPVE
jgi:hypothetical protein